MAPKTMEIDAGPKLAEWQIIIMVPWKTPIGKRFSGRYTVVYKSPTYFGSEEAAMQEANKLFLEEVRKAPAAQMYVVRRWYW